MVSLFRKNKPVDPTKMAFGHGLAVADAQRSPSDIEEAKLLGINQHMINDDRMRQFLEGMAIESHVEKINNKDVIIRNAVPRYAAVYIASSSLIRTSIIDPIDAQIGILETRCLLRKVKMSMTEAEYENGGALMIDAVKLVNETAWLDAQGGNKAKLLKVSPKSYEVTFRESNGQKGGFGQ